MSSPNLLWDMGTGYDLFVSLHTLHHPKDFGLRGSWAVGVRSRLPAPEREFLQGTMVFLGWPIDWVYEAVPAPKNATAVLSALRQIPPAERLPLLSNLNPEGEIQQRLLEIGVRGAWNHADEEFLHQRYAKLHHRRIWRYKRQDLAYILPAWRDLAAFGEKYLTALEAYYEVFFAEDEERLEPSLAQALERAQALAEQMPVVPLLKELSQGVEFEQAPDVPNLVLVPSFWGSPLLLYGRNTAVRQLLMFGARPATDSLVPGDVVADALFNGLKALADPTRLRILRYLVAEPLTPTELARRLRLRAPTVVHHLHALRLARMVNLTLTPDGQRYTARREVVQETCAMLNDFLDQKDEA
jgi:DNA-binding transcriptional ArsR family regulator